jgi:hypothetical protein
MRRQSVNGIHEHNLDRKTNEFQEQRFLSGELQMISPSFCHLPLDDICFDPTNPRIRHVLEDEENNSTDAFTFALLTYDPSFKELQAAIRQYGGIINPIKINKQDKRLTVFEGNTRLAIYHRFRANNVLPGDWAEIPCAIYEDLSPEEIDRLRLQDHMIGTRAWTPYAKARYLFELNNRNEPLSGLVEFCGGNRAKVHRMIDAFQMMENLYKSVIENDPELSDESWNHEKFTAFEEFQLPKRRQSLEQRGHDDRDFASWVAHGKFHRNEDVRKLPDIMENDQAYTAFIKYDSLEATRYLMTGSDGDLTKFSLAVLCNAIYSIIRHHLSRSHIQNITTDEQQVDTIKTTLIELQAFADTYFDDS